MSSQPKSCPDPEPKITFTQRTERECASIIRQLRWPKYVTCPTCGCDRIHPVAKSHPHLCHYHCASCYAWFNDLSGSCFRRTRQPLWVWFALIELDAQGLNGRQASEQVPVSIPGTYYLRSVIQSDPLCAKIRAYILEPEQFPAVEVPPPDADLPPHTRPAADLVQHYTDRIDW